MFKFSKTLEHSKVKISVPDIQIEYMESGFWHLRINGKFKSLFNDLNTVLENLRRDGVLNNFEIDEIMREWHGPERAHQKIYNRS